ncbi:MAG: hypothetical protein ACE5JG_05145 [Planctomycetota bacterium]
MSAVLLVAGLLVACTATDRRISKNEDVFNTYPPEVQAMIKSNRIAQGFDTTQVYLSWGTADKTTSDGERETWTYIITHNKTVEKEKGAYEYALERKEWEEALARGEPVPEPTPTKQVSYYRSRVAKVVVFVGGRVQTWEEPEAGWLDDWHL